MKFMDDTGWEDAHDPTSASSWSELCFKENYCSDGYCETDVEDERPGRVFSRILQEHARGVKWYSP